MAIQRPTASVWTMLACLGTAFAALPANAADLAAPLPEPFAPWAGFYIGGHAGGAVARNRTGIDFPRINGAPGGVGPGAAGGAGGGFGPQDGTLEVTDGIAGAHIGYNFQFGNFVAGVEGDASVYTSLETVVTTGRARVGYATDRFMIFGTGGLAHIHVDDGLTVAYAGGLAGNGGNGGNGVIAGNGGGGGAGVPNFPLVRPEQDEFGFVAGGGAEVRVNPRATIGVEALYHSFDGIDPAFGIDDEFVVIRSRASFALGDPAGRGGPLPGGVQTANWGGLYFGANGGLAFDANDSTIDEVRRVPGEPGQPGANGIPLDGGGGGGGGGAGGLGIGFLNDDVDPLGGIHVGYNFQRDRFVFGLEGDASFTDGNRDYLASIRGRVGVSYLTHMFYATGGVAFTGIEGENVVVGGDAGNGGNGDNSVALGGTGAGGAGGAGGVAIAGDQSEDLVGFVVGGGMETKITDNLSLGAEALYYGFDGEDGDLNAFPNVPGFRFAGNDDADALVLRARLSYTLPRTRL